MHDDSRRQSFLFPDLLNHAVHAAFDESDTTSDGGAPLLKALDDRVGLTATPAGAITDRRQPGKGRHTLEELARQHVFGLAQGCEDANDAARLGRGVRRITVGLEPMDGPAHGRQPGALFNGFYDA